MVSKRYIPQIIAPEIKANWKDYQVEEAFLSMKGDKRKWSEVAFTLKYTPLIPQHYYKIFFLST